MKLLISILLTLCASSLLAQSIDQLHDAKSVVAGIEDRFKQREQVLNGHYATPAMASDANNDADFLRIVVMCKAESADEKSVQHHARELLLKVERQGRRLYASSLEHEFLRQGISATVTADGKDNRELRLSYPLMSKAAVYKMHNETALKSQARQLGFTKLLYSDGYSEEWASNMQK